MTITFDKRVVVGSEHRVEIMGLVLGATVVEDVVPDSVVDNVVPELARVDVLPDAIEEVEERPCEVEGGALVVALVVVLDCVSIELEKVSDVDDGSCEVVEVVLVEVSVGEVEGKVAVSGPIEEERDNTD